MSKNKRNINIVIVVVVLLFIVSAGYYVWSKNQQMVNGPEVQAAKIEEQKKLVLEKVKALVAVPDEKPIFFTVSNSEILKTQQPFFVNAQNGDVLLVFEKNKTAALYRDSVNQIINIGPIGTSTATTTKLKK